jgi:molybdate transport system substrate-binding protein
MRTGICLLFSLSLLFAAPARADQITVAVAAGFKFAMDEIVTQFKKDNPGDEVGVVYGSSGKVHAQIKQAAPYDLFFSADIAFASDLVKSGLAASGVKTYAIGRIVLWSATEDATKMTLANLTDPKITHIAIANPKHAPYGQRAEEALRASRLWDKVKSKLVYGENITQTAQFVQTGNAQVGIIALSLAVNPELASKGGYWLIPDKLHQPLEQGFIITKRAAGSALAKRFARYMDSKSARAIMTKYGFVLPGKTNATVTVHAPEKPTVKSPVRPGTPGGSTRILLPVNDESDRGRKPVLRDELAVVVLTSTYPCERIHATHR